MSNWLPTKETVCPSCGGKNNAFHKSKGTLEDKLTLCAVRVCRDCGTIFEPPAHPGWAITALVLGAGMLVIVLSDKVPTIYRALAPLSLGRLLRECFFMMCLLVFGIQIFIIGWRGFRRKVARIVR